MEDHLKSNPTGSHILVILSYCLNECQLHHPSTSFCTSFHLIQLRTAPSPAFACSPLDILSLFRSPSSNFCLTEDLATVSREAAILHKCRLRRQGRAFLLTKATPTSLFLSASWKNSCSFKDHAIWLLKFIDSTKIY